MPLLWRKKMAAVDYKVWRKEHEFVKIRYRAKDASAIAEGIGCRRLKNAA